MSLTKRLNLIRSGLNLIFRRLKPWSMPIHMQIELTNFCNLRCPVCPAGIREVKRRPVAMDIELFKSLMAEVGPFLLTVSLWGWGEPLLHPYLINILRETRKYPVIVFLSTNGQNLNDDKVIAALIQAPPTHLIIAIDGLNDETHSKYRIGAKLAPILEGVKRISEFKMKQRSQLPVLHMRYIVMKHNQHEVPFVIDFARRNHFDFLSIRTLSIIDSQFALKTHNDLLPESAAFQAYQYKNGKRVEHKDYICFQPFWFPSVFSDGTLVVCEQDFNAQLSLGVVSKETLFTTLWNSEASLTARRAIRDNPKCQSFCQQCPYRDREIIDCSIQGYSLRSM